MVVSGGPRDNPSSSWFLYSAWLSQGARLQLHAADPSAVLSAVHAEKQTQLCLFQKLHIVIICSLGVMPPGQLTGGAAPRCLEFWAPFSSLTARLWGRPSPAE